ncbi:hypothetical protein [Flagellimonas sp.]|uniref:hypothetical protein n=1 Tax=Flagellimonas sp. TaxID=2058762 RepID=UPI003AB1A07C
MKSLKHRNNVEKAQLLAGLFPEEMPGILSDIAVRAQYLKEHREDLQKTWDNGLLTFPFWEDLAQRVEQAMEKYQSRLLERPRLFADQLFDGYNALFTIDCIVKYAEAGNGSKPFRLAVDMLFSYHA